MNGDPLCVVCKTNRVPKHELPVLPNPAICDACLRANQVTGTKRTDG